MAKSSYKKVIALGLDYSDFQGGIKDCTEEMKKLDSEHKALASEMENTASGSEKLAEKNDYLTKKIELQSKKVEIAKKKLDELTNSENATESQVRKATTAFNNETAELNRLNNELSDTVMKQNNLKTNAAMLATVITAVGAAAAKCVSDVMEYADSIATLSEQTGVAVETLQAWDYASDFIDTDFQTMTNAFRKLEATMASSPQVFEELGVSIKDSSGHMRDAESVYMDTIDALGKVRNATEQDQLAMEIFGKSATELTGMINAGSQGLKEYQQEAQELGVILSSEEIQAANECKDAFDKLGATFDSAKMKIGAELAPAITVIAQAIASIPAPVLATVAVVGSLIAIIGLLVATIASAIKSFTTISSAIAATTFTMNPQILLVTALVAAFALLVYEIAQLVKVYKELKQAQQEVNNTASEMSTMVSQGPGGRGGKTDHKAAGGYSEGGLTWVGEAGPELVDLPRGSRVYNSNESKQISNSPTYNISMNLDITKLKSVNDVVDAVQGLGLSAGVGGLA